MEPVASLADSEERTLRQALGLRLKRAREHQGLSQSAVARVLDMPRQSVIRLETGVRGLDVLELLQFARLYERSANELLGVRPGDPRCSELDELARHLRHRDYQRLLSLARALGRSGCGTDKKLRPGASPDGAGVSSDRLRRT